MPRAKSCLTGRMLISGFKVDNEAGEEVYRASLKFEAQSAEDAQRAAEQDAAEADAAAEAIAAALTSKA